MATINNFIVSNSGAITTIIDGEPYMIPSDHPAYEQACEALRAKDGDKFIELVRPAQQLPVWSEGGIEVKDNEVLYNGSVVTLHIAQRIINLMQHGFDYSWACRFLARLMNNPSFRSRHELDNFLEHRNMPFTEDGCFLGYKAIKNNWTDKYSGKFDNRIGATPNMRREEVDDDCSEECSYGLHIGSLEYATNYASGDDRVIICKIDPANAVSVPKHDANKLRVCAYEVISEYTRPLPKYAATNDGFPVGPDFEEEPEDDDPEDDFDDDSSED